MTAAEAAAAPPDFKAVYDETFSYVVTVLRRLGIKPNDLADLAHDTFLAAFRHWADYDPRRPVRPWLFGIAYRVCLDFKRLARQRFEQLGVATAPQPDPRALPDEQAALRQTQTMALTILDQLSDEQRAVFVMHELEGHSMPEVVDALQIPLNTAYSRLRLARHHFNDAAAALRQEQR